MVSVNGAEKWEGDTEPRKGALITCDHGDADVVGGITAPQRCPPPNPRNLRTHYRPHGSGQLRSQVEYRWKGMLADVETGKLAWSGQEILKEIIRVLILWKEKKSQLGSHVMRPRVIWPLPALKT